MKRSVKRWNKLLYSDGLPYKDFDSLLVYSARSRERYQPLASWLASLPTDRQKEAWKQIKACCSRRRSR